MITRECKPIQELWKNAEAEKSIVKTKRQLLQVGVKDLEPENIALKVQVNKIATNAIHEMSMDSNCENRKGEQSSKLQPSVEERLSGCQGASWHQIIVVLFISLVLCMMLDTIRREAGYSCAPFVIPLFIVVCVDSLPSVGNLGSHVHKRVDVLLCIYVMPYSVYM